MLKYSGKEADVCFFQNTGERKKTDNLKKDVVSIIVLHMSLCLPQPPLRPPVRTGSAALTSSALRSPVVKTAASVAPYLPPRTDRQALWVRQL